MDGKQKSKYWRNIFIGHTEMKTLDKARPMADGCQLEEANIKCNKSFRQMIAAGETDA